MPAMFSVRPLAFCSMFIFIVVYSTLTETQSSSSMAVSATVGEDCQVSPGRLEPPAGERRDLHRPAHGHDPVLGQLNCEPRCCDSLPF